jgi:hypothetical protein
MAGAGSRKIHANWGDDEISFQAANLAVSIGTIQMIEKEHPLLVLIFKKTHQSSVQ